MRKFAVIVYLFCVHACYNQDSPAITDHKNALTEVQLREDLSILESNLSIYHPDLDLYTPRERLDSLFRSLEQRLEDGLEPMAFFRLLTPTLPMIGNNHTDILPPASYVRYLLKEAKRFPFSLHYRHDTLFVIEDSSKEQVIGEGAIIYALNGVPIHDIFDRLMANMSTDGYNKTLPRLRASKGFSRAYAYHYGTPDIFEVTYSDSSNVLKKAVIEAIPVAGISKIRALKNTSPAKETEEYSFHIRNDIGILTIRTFSISSTRKYRRFLKDTFDTIAKKNLPAVVLDLRDNLGGYPEESSELFSYFIDEPVFPTRAEYALVKSLDNASHFLEERFYKHFQNQKFIEKNGLFHVKGGAETRIVPKSNAFKGDVYVIMNASCTSTTGQLLGLLKAYTGAIFAGEEAGGNPVTIVANDILTLQLPNSHIEVKLPLIKTENNVNFENKGRGILPDIPIQATIKPSADRSDRGMTHVLEIVKRRLDEGSGSE